MGVEVIGFQGVTRGVRMAAVCCMDGGWCGSGADEELAAVEEERMQVGHRPVKLRQLEHSSRSHCSHRSRGCWAWQDWQCGSAALLGGGLVGEVEGDDDSERST